MFTWRCGQCEWVGGIRSLAVRTVHNKLVSVCPACGSADRLEALLRGKGWAPCTLPSTEKILEDVLTTGE